MEDIFPIPEEKKRGGYSKSGMGLWTGDTAAFIRARIDAGFFKSHVHGNVKWFYEVTVPAMGFTAEDFPDFKGTASTNVSGHAIWSSPTTAAKKNLFDGWNLKDIGGLFTRVDGIDFVILVARHFRVKPSYLMIGAPEPEESESEGPLFQIDEQAATA